MFIRVFGRRRPPIFPIVGVVLVSMGAGMLLVIVIPAFAFVLAIAMVLIGLFILFF